MGYNRLNSNTSVFFANKIIAFKNMDRQGQGLPQHLPLSSLLKVKQKEIDSFILKQKQVKNIFINNTKNKPTLERLGGRASKREQKWESTKEVNYDTQYSISTLMLQNPGFQWGKVTQTRLYPTYAL